MAWLGFANDMTHTHILYLELTASDLPFPSCPRGTSTKKIPLLPSKHFSYRQQL